MESKKWQIARFTYTPISSKKQWFFQGMDKVSSDSENLLNMVKGL